MITCARFPTKGMPSGRSKVPEARVISCLQCHYATPPDITKGITSFSSASGTLEALLLQRSKFVQASHFAASTPSCSDAFYLSMSAGSIFIGHLPVVVRLVAAFIHFFRNKSCLTDSKAGSLCYRALERRRKLSLLGGLSFKKRSCAQWHIEGKQYFGSICVGCSV